MASRHLSKQIAVRRPDGSRTTIRIQQFAFDLGVLFYAPKSDQSDESNFVEALKHMFETGEVENVYDAEIEIIKKCLKERFKHVLS